MAELVKEKTDRPGSFALIALICGMLALTGSVAYFWLGPIEPPSKLEDVIADKAVKIRDKVVAKLKRTKTTTQKQEVSRDLDKIAMASIACTSLLAILLSVIGFVRHEPIRMVGSAAVLGSTALALQYLLVAIGAIVFAIIIAGVLAGLDFTP